MNGKKVIAVVGATGAQGGGLVRAILADPASGFTARAITRNPDSPAARALAEAGAEVVAGDVDDAAGVERAFQGAYGAYCVTFFWAHFSVDREQAEARHMADAAKAAGVQHLVWSTLEDTRQYVPLTDDRMPTLQGKYKVPHFDGKGEMDAYFAATGVPTTYLLASFYWDNFIGFGAGPKKGPDGDYLLTLPIGQAPMAGIAAEDIGKCALGIFKAGAAMAGQRIGVAGDQLTGEQMATAMTRAIGKTVKFNEVEPAVYRSFGFPGADDLGNMFQFYRDFAEVCNTTRDVARSRSINPALQSFDTWLAANAAKIPLD